MMKIKATITPRSINDTGGIACMPLKKNIPNPKDGWKLTTCPKCKRECWETEILINLKKIQNIKALCTECALIGDEKKF